MDENLKKYDNDGYVVLPNVLSKDNISSIYNQIESLIDEVILNNKIDVESSFNLDEKYFALKEQNPDIKSHFYNMTRYLDSLLSSSSSSRIINHVKKLLLSDTTLSEGPQIRIDDTSNDRIVPFHQELSQISIKNVTLWIPLIDINGDTGGINIIPKSHKNGYVPHEFYEEYHNYYCIKKDYPIDNSRAIKVRANAGDAIAFDGASIHGSSPNKTNKIRWVLIIRYSGLKGVPYLSDVNAALRIPYDANYNNFIK